MSFLQTAFTVICKKQESHLKSWSLVKPVKVSRLMPFQFKSYCCSRTHHRCWLSLSSPLLELSIHTRSNVFDAPLKTSKSWQGWFPTLLITAQSYSTRVWCVRFHLAVILEGGLFQWLSVMITKAPICLLCWIWAPDSIHVKHLTHQALITPGVSAEVWSKGHCHFTAQPVDRKQNWSTFDLV